MRRAGEVNGQLQQRGAVVTVGVVAIVLMAVGLLLLAQRAGRSTTGLADQPPASTAPTESRDPLAWHLDWMTAALNGADVLDAQQVRMHLNDAFLAQVPLEDVQSTFVTAGQGLRWDVHEVVHLTDEVAAWQLEASDGEQARLTMQLDDAGLVAASTVLRAVECPPLQESTELAPELRAQLDWAVGAVNGPQPVALEELEERLDPTFLAQVPLDEAQQAFADLHAIGPLQHRWFVGTPAPHSLTARYGVSTGEEALLNLTITPDPPHRITAFGVFTQQPCILP